MSRSALQAIRSGAVLAISMSEIKYVPDGMTRSRAVISSSRVSRQRLVRFLADAPNACAIYDAMMVSIMCQVMSRCCVSVLFKNEHHLWPQVVWLTHARLMCRMQDATVGLSGMDETVCRMRHERLGKPCESLDANPCMQMEHSKDDYCTDAAFCGKGLAACGLGPVKAYQRQHKGHGREVDHQSLPWWAQASIKDRLPY